MYSQKLLFVMTLIISTIQTVSAGFCAHQPSYQSSSYHGYPIGWQTTYGFPVGWATPYTQNKGETWQWQTIIH